MENPHPAPEKKGINSSVFFVMGWAALFLMALMWSLDASFFYILLGLACIFFFMGYWTRGPVPARARREAEPAKQYYQRSQRRQESGPAFWQTVAAAFKRRTVASPQPRPATPVAAAQRKVVLAVSLVVGGVFMIIVFGAIFGGSGESGFDNLQQAEQYFNQQEYESALQYYRRSLKEDPEKLDALWGYGKTLSMLDRADSAHIMYDKVLSIDPAYDLVRYDKAWLYFYQKNHSRAIETLQQLLARNSSFADGYQLLGDVYYDQRNYDEARRHYQTAYDSGLRSKWLCHVLAYLHDIKNETPRAIDLYKEALTYDSAATDIYQRLGELIPGEEGEAYRLRVTDRQW